MAPVAPPYDQATTAALEALGPPIMLFRMFARRPERARAIHGWGSYYLSRRSALSLRHRELVIDRTTALCGAEYEWAIHISVYAAKANLTGAQVRSLAGVEPHPLVRATNARRSPPSDANLNAACSMTNSPSRS
jgi:alkylhydroperoxidase family enzyme